jgi:hypothetical protein
MGSGAVSRRWAVNTVWLHDLLIGCFDFILDLCIFLKMVRCQFMSGGQKTPPFCHDRMAPALKDKHINY